MIFVYMALALGKGLCRSYRDHLFMALDHVLRAEKHIIDCDEKRLLVENEIARTEAERSCKVCLDQPSSVVFEPCLHCCACQSCAAKIQTCAVCRAPIEGRIRIYLC